MLAFAIRVGPRALPIWVRTSHPSCSRLLSSSPSSPAGQGKGTSAGTSAGVSGKEQREPQADPPPETGSGASGDAGKGEGTAREQSGETGGNGRGSGAGRGPMTWGAVGLLGATGLALAQYYQSEREKQKTKVVSQVKSTGKPALGGPWTLVDMHGQPRTDKDYHGTHTLLYFGFTHCPDICPSELVKVGAIMDKLEEKVGPGRLKPLFVSVDPERDSLQQLRHYAQDFHPSMEYLTGTKDQVAKAAKAYRVYFSKTDEHDESEDYLVDHSIVLYLNGPDGDFVDFFTQRTTASDCADQIAAIIQGKQ